MKEKTEKICLIYSSLSAISLSLSTSICLCLLPLLFPIFFLLFQKFLFSIISSTILWCQRSPFNMVPALFAQQTAMCKNKSEYLRLQSNNFSYLYQWNIFSCSYSIILLVCWWHLHISLKQELQKARRWNLHFTR